MLKQDLGKKGEDLALKFLKSQKYKIIARNFRCRLGEIDIIAQDKETLVFIEVKTRWSQKFGPPEEAVTPWKIKSIVKTGQYFKLLHPDLPENLRIDVVAISLSPGGEVENINLIKNASF
jgi:putative endonuclease